MSRTRRAAVRHVTQVLAPRATAANRCQGHHAPIARMTVIRHLHLHIHASALAETHMAEKKKGNVTTLPKKSAKGSSSVKGGAMRQKPRELER